MRNRLRKGGSERSSRYHTRLKKGGIRRVNRCRGKVCLRGRKRGEGLYVICYVGGLVVGGLDKGRLEIDGLWTGGLGRRGRRKEKRGSGVGTLSGGRVKSWKRVKRQGKWVKREVT